MHSINDWRMIFRRSETRKAQTASGYRNNVSPINRESLSRGMIDISECNMKLLTNVILLFEHDRNILLY